MYLMTYLVSNDENLECILAPNYLKKKKKTVLKFCQFSDENLTWHYLKASKSLELNLILLSMP